MQIHIRSQQIAVEKTLRSHIERRLEFSLGRFSARIMGATVRLIDVNGPRGGEDKTCRIDVRLRPTGSVFVEDRDANLRVVVDRAADRIGRSVVRALERHRSSERRNRVTATTSRAGTNLGGPDREPVRSSALRQKGKCNEPPTL